MTMVKEGKLDLKLAIAAIEKGASPREPLPAQASPLETCLPGPCFERDRRRAQFAPVGQTLETVMAARTASNASASKPALEATLAASE